MTPFCPASPGARHLPGGPPGTRTPNLRIKSLVRTAGDKAARSLSWAFASQCYPSFPIVSRSFTGMRRDGVHVGVAITHAIRRGWLTERDLQPTTLFAQAPFLSGVCDRHAPCRLETSRGCRPPNARGRDAVPCRTQGRKAGCARSTTRHSLGIRTDAPNRYVPPGLCATTTEHEGQAT